MIRFPLMLLEFRHLYLKVCKAEKAFTCFIHFENFFPQSPIFPSKERLPVQFLPPGLRIKGETVGGRSEAAGTC